jgi:hypothetical protein
MRQAYGVNGEHTFFGSTKLGASYIAVDPELPGFDGWMSRRAL